MEDGRGACAYLAKAAAAFTVLSLLPVALSGSAPSHVSPGLLPISTSDATLAPASGDVPFVTSLFATFGYDRGLVAGTFVQFNYNASSGSIRSYLASNVLTPVLYVGSIQILGFLPMGAPQLRGPIFDAQGYEIEMVAHDDPTGLLEIRTDVARIVVIELPASATNISSHSTPGSWPASSVSYSIGEDQARLVLGAGTFVVSGTHLAAMMATSDLLVFKAVPAESPNKAEWRAVLDAIASGQVVAEMDLVATAGGQWVENSAMYRFDVSAWPRAVTPGKASVFVGSPSPRGAVVLLAFDAATMPADATRNLTVRANDVAVNRTADALALFYAPEARADTPAYAILKLPGTVLALYLPALASTSVDVESVVPPQPSVSFAADSELAFMLALVVVAGAAAQMFRRRES